MSAGQYIDVGGIAQVTFDAVVAHFAASSVILPDRRFIAPGNPRELSWDNCESMFVAYDSIAWGTGPGTGSSGTARQTGNQVSATVMRHTIIEVQIVRRVPEFDGSQLPSTDDLTESALRVCKDAGLLSQSLVEVSGRDGPLKEFGVAIAGAVEILGPRGGFCSSAGNLTITAGQLVNG